jgi:type IV pilus assembly protein PilM
MSNILNKIFNPKKKFAGLDIGTGSVKFMEIEGSNLENAKIIHYATELIPPEVISSDGNIINIDILGETIKKCWKKSGSSNKNIVLALSSNDILTRKSIIPIFESEEETRLKVEEEISDKLGNGMSIENFSIDFVNLGVNEQSPTDVDMLLIAGKKDKIETRLGAVELAGLTPTILDVDVFAIQNLLRMMKGEDFLNKNYMLLDCGATNMKLLVFKKGELVHTRETDTGGKSLTRDIMLNLGLDKEEEAEKVKIDRLGDETYDAIEKQFLMNYISEFIRTYQYYINTNSGIEIEELILVGGIAGIPKIEEYFSMALEENFDKTIKNAPYVARPLANMNKHDKVSLTKFHRDEPSLFLVSSLALRHFLRQY